VSTQCKTIFAVTSFAILLLNFFTPVWCL